MKDDLAARYEDPEFDHLLELSSFLDPRFKLNYVSSRAQVLEEVEREMRELIECPSPTDATSVDGPSHLPSTSSSEGDVSESAVPPLAAPPIKKARGLSRVLGHCLGNSLSVLTPQQRVKQELDQYLSHPHVYVEDLPLNWWKIEALWYSNVVKLARKYLCLCATSVANRFIKTGWRKSLANTLRGLLNGLTTEKVWMV